MRIVFILFLLGFTLTVRSQVVEMPGEMNIKVEVAPPGINLVSYCI